MKNKKGFTLVELIVVIVILGILAVIAVPAYNSYTAKAKNNKEATSVSAAYSMAYAEAVEKYSTDVTTDATATSGDVTVKCTSAKEPSCEVTAKPTGSTCSYTLANGEINQTGCQ